MSDRASAVLSTGSAPDPLIGRVIGGRFRVTALIARGGMGKVYRAEQAPLGRVCAIKVLNPSYAGEHDPEFHKRFFLEASIASKLTHPNTVTIFDYGRSDDDIYYMAMEYLDGHTLHRAIREAGYLPEERVVHIARQICRALREAHSVGVIHRDLKPANIFLMEHGDESDFVKVLDFGLVKLADNKGEDLTQTGMFMGSPKYMSPEQIRGDRVDARSDIYALGIILYEMLTGKVPFDRPNSVNILMAHVGEEPAPLRRMNPDISVSGALEETVSKCLAKDADGRLSSMDEVLVALKRASGLARNTITGLEATERGSLSASGSGPRLGSGGLTGAPRGTAGATQAMRAGEPFGTVARSSLASDLAPHRARPTLASSGRAGSKVVLVAAVAGSLAVALGIAYAAVRTRSTAPAGVAVLPAAAKAVPAGPAMKAEVSPASTEAAESIARVRVSTEPDGASVKEDGVEVCSSTPCDIVYSGPGADSGRLHRLTLARQGYRVEVRVVKSSDPPLAVKLSLLPRAAPVAPPRVDAPATVPTGYKTDLPY